VINIKKRGFHNKVTKKRHFDVATSVPTGQGRHNFRAFEKNWEPTKAEKRRRKKRLVHERTELINEVLAHKQKEKCKLYKRKLAKSLPIYRGTTVCSEVLANFP
jgi:hypothetical protein